jgi:SAM-dependent methyltransferase
LYINRSEFVRQYHKLIVGREFVEYKDYYKHSVSRFWTAFDKIQRLPLPQPCKAIDIGGGIMAVLLSKILEMNACVGDVNERAASDLSDFGVKFQLVDLTFDDKAPNEMFDLVILQEVIEHMPHPPYIVFERIKKFLKPEGILFLTTPNGSRVRNILYMLIGKQVLDNFRYPEPGQSLGHQHEYTLPQLVWQLQRAGMVALSADQYDTWGDGYSFAARVAHTLEKPASIFPHLRSGLMIAAQRPVAG